MNSLINNIPIKPSVAIPSLDIPTAEELNKKFPLEETAKRNAEKVYLKYILPRVEKGYKSVYLPLLDNKQIGVLNKESLPQDIKLLYSLQAYLKEKGYKVEIIRENMYGGIGVKYFGMTIAW